MNRDPKDRKSKRFDTENDRFDRDEHRKHIRRERDQPRRKVWRSDDEWYETETADDSAGDEGES